MKSSYLKSIDYDPDTEKLVVVFVSGHSYVYSDVPADQVAALESAPSAGAYFSDNIRLRYSYKEIT